MELNRPKFYTKYDSPVGELFLICDEDYLFRIEFGEPPKDTLVDLIEKPKTEVFQLTKNWLDLYFAGENPDPKLVPIKFVGTDFRRLVWSNLLAIRYGKTMTYCELAKIVADKMQKKSMANQAIGQAVGANPLPILVPCHRVVGSDGNLTGYSGGLDKKITFLTLEGVDLSRFYLPEEKTSKKKATDNSEFKQLDLDL